jgi:hypothetical protein
VDRYLRGRLGEIGGERRQVVIANAEYDYLTTTEEGRQTTVQIKGAEYTETKGIGHFPRSENHPVFKEYLQQVLQKIEERAPARSGVNFPLRRAGVRAFLCSFAYKRPF